MSGVLNKPTTAHRIHFLPSYLQTTATNYSLLTRNHRLQLTNRGYSYRSLSRLQLEIRLLATNLTTQKKTTHTLITDWQSRFPILAKRLKNRKKRQKWCVSCVCSSLSENTVCPTGWELFGESTYSVRSVRSLCFVVFSFCWEPKAGSKVSGHLSPHGR